MDEEDLSKKRGRGGDDHGTKDSVNLEDLWKVDPSDDDETVHTS
jgi:hypothetical protein